MTAWLGLEKKNNFLACPLPLFTKEETATASAILHSSFYILHLINE